MGGLVCMTITGAVLRFDAVPADPNRVIEFDSQMRELFSHPIITVDLAQTPSLLHKAVPILKKDSWTASDRATLLDIIESLYE